MTDAGRIFRVVAGRDDGERRARTVWNCPTCTKDSRPSGPLIRIAQEAYVEAGKVEPSAERWACLVCFQRGKLTLV